MAKVYRAGFISPGGEICRQRVGEVSARSMGDSVSMHNPAWYEFVQRVVVKAARSLGTKSDVGGVAAKLAKITFGSLMLAYARMPPRKAWVV